MIELSVLHRLRYTNTTGAVSIRSSERRSHRRIWRLSINGLATLFVTRKHLSLSEAAMTWRF